MRLWWLHNKGKSRTQQILVSTLRDGRLAICGNREIATGRVCRNAAEAHIITGDGRESAVLRGLKCSSEGAPALLCEMSAGSKMLTDCKLSRIRRPVENRGLIFFLRALRLEGESKSSSRACALTSPAARLSVCYDPIFFLCRWKPFAELA